METVLPYKNEEGSKKEQVAKMFDNISPKYDFLNRVLSIGIDIIWRKKAVKMLKADQPKLILDIATGTGDFALEALSLNPDKIYGIDISVGMLKFGIEKIKEKNLSDKIILQEGDSENIQFSTEYFDAVIVAFGVRNFENLEKGLTEILRVLKPGKKLVVLEFSKPKVFPIKQLYQFYSKFILPLLGKTVSGDDSAYKYLPDSVAQFPEGEHFTQILDKIGFKNTSCTPLTFGISSIYVGQKQA